MVAVIVALLEGPLSTSAGAAEQGLRAIGNLTSRVDNTKLLGAAGACAGKWLGSVECNRIASIGYYDLCKSIKPEKLIAITGNG